MFIDKFTAHIKDLHSKKAKKITINADDAHTAHKKALDYCNQLTQDIIKITNGEKAEVFNIEEGFINI